ncbi:MAG: hypothetical protein NTW90_01910 [Nitrosospira sp.]|nr:hypothetical protein [Nitrosospira sp.]
MNKLLAASVAAIFVFGSTAALAEQHSTEEIGLTHSHTSARTKLIEMDCKDKKPGETIMDPTDARKKVKCHETKK